MKGIQVVLVAANPRGTTPLQLDDEVRRIEAQLAHSAYAQALASHGAAVHIQLRAVWAAQFVDLVRNVAIFQPAILQFSGHGEGPPGLVMVGDSGRPILIPSPALRDVLSEFAETTRLVVLNACHSTVQAEVIRSVVDCVIGMKAGISDQGAAIFSAALYGQLALGSSVGRSFRLARAIMAAQVPADSDVPMLQTRDGIHADDVHFVPNTQSAPSGQDWRQMLQSAEPPLSMLRQAINLALPKDVDLEAFIQDRRQDPRYARVHREWGADMQRQRKLSLLFDYGPGPREIKADLLDFMVG